MTLVHQLTKFSDSLLVIHFFNVASGLEFLHALSLTKDMHGSLVKEVLRILGHDFVDMRHVAHCLKHIIDISLTF